MNQQGVAEQKMFPLGEKFWELCENGQYVNQVDIQLQSFKQLLKDCVSELSNELQVATDGAKSALRPDDNII